MNRFLGVCARQYYWGRLLLCALLLLPIAAQAHHSAAAYNTASTASVTGIVSELQWRNPHVILKVNVLNEDGSITEWPLETAGIQDLIADGWNRDILSPGTRVTAEIRPTQRGVPGGILRWVTLADGRVLPIDDASPAGVQIAGSASTGSDATQDPQERLMALAEAGKEAYLERREEFAQWEEGNRPASLPLDAETGQMGALDPDNLAAHEGVALYDFSGVWAHRSNREKAAALGGFPWDFLPVPELTPKSQAILDDVMARRAAGDATADPATLCYPHGLMRSMTRVGNMMLLQQNTALFMVHRMNNDYRAIYWDGRDHVDASVRIQSYNGDSIATWVDDYMFVETVGFGSPLMYVNSGIPIGEQGRVEERWRLINDGNTIEIEFRMTDPEHWVGEWVDTKLWDRIHGADIFEGNCIVAEDGDLAIGGTPATP